MGTTEQSFQPRSDAFPDMTGQAAYPTPNWVRRLSADANALSSTTKALFPSGTGTSLVTLRPTLSVTATQSPATEANKKLCGWVMNPRGSLGLDSVATAKRFIPAGQWRFKCRLTATVTQPTTQTTVYIDVYKRHTDGTFTHLFNCSGLVAVATAGSQIDLIAVPGQITFEEDETLHVAVTIQAPTVAVTGQEITFQHNSDVIALGTLQSLWIFPAPGVRTLFPRAGGDSAPTTEALARLAAFPRALPESAPAGEQLVTTTTLTRALTDAASSADALARLARFPRALADAAPAVASLARIFAAPRALADLAPASDALARAMTAARALVESAPSSDTMGRSSVLFRRLVGDEAPAVDAVSRALAAARGLADAAPAAEEVDRGAILFRRLTVDGAPAADVLARQLNNVRTVRDNIGPEALDPIEHPTRALAGIVRDATGAPVAGAVVKLFRQSDDRAVRTTTSGGDGSYSFPRDLFDTETYYVLSYLDGVPQTQGVSERGLVPS